MKYKLRSKLATNIIFSMILIVLLIFIVIINNYYNTIDVISNSYITSNISNKSTVIDEYITNNNIIANIKVNDNIVSILTYQDGRYSSVLFDYSTQDYLEKEDIISNLDLFNEKVEYLLYLKYPKFIADSLILDSTIKVYYFSSNELIIYYYEYQIEPNIDEELYLKVNYNEIYEYLNIDVVLDLEYENEDGTKIDDSKKLVAITFDDGPGIYTDRLVSILKDNRATSTFFMVTSNIVKYPSTVLNVYNSGMEIGYHSYNHTNFKYQTLEEILDEFNESNRILTSLTGSTFKLTRPPYGSIPSGVKEALPTSFILWNVDTEDWRYKDSDYLVNYVLENISDGYIILFHDIHETSVDAIEKLLPILYSEGYQVTTVSNLASRYNIELEVGNTYRYFK